MTTPPTLSRYFFVMETKPSRVESSRVVLELCSGKAPIVPFFFFFARPMWTCESTSTLFLYQRKCGLQQAPNTQIACKHDNKRKKTNLEWSSSRYSYHIETETVKTILQGVISHMGYHITFLSYVHHKLPEQLQFNFVLCGGHSQTWISPIHNILLL